jgi:hypothetical protein
LDLDKLDFENKNKNKKQKQKQTPTPPFMGREGSMYIDIVLTLSKV